MVNVSPCAHSFPRQNPAVTCKLPLARAPPQPDDDLAGLSPTATSIDTVSSRLYIYLF